MIKKLLASVVLTALALSGCVESPTDIGSSLLPPSDKFEVKVVSTDTLNINETSAYFKKKIDLGSAPRILLGKYNGLTSTALLRFFVLLPDSVKDALNGDSLTVKSAWVEIQPNYTLGDKGLPFGFSVYKINNFWLPADYDADSLAALDYDANPVATVTNPDDSLFKFDIPQDLAMEWIKQSTDTEHPENNGVMLKPDDATQRIIGFQGITNFKHSDEPVLKIIVERTGSFIDTLTESITSDVHVITGEPAITNPANINLLSDYSLRGYFYFDVSFMPKDAIINKAVFTLRIDSTATFEGSAMTDTLEVKMAADSTAKDSVENAEKIYLYRRGWKFEGDISHFVQKWIDGKINNQGLRLRLTDENRTLNMISLFSEKAVEREKRPLVRIYYTDKK